MRSSGLLAYFPLVLSLGIGVLAQSEMAECLAGSEWVRLFFLSISYGFVVPGTVKDTFTGAPKPKQGINNNILALYCRTRTPSAKTRARSARSSTPIVAVQVSDFPHFPHIHFQSAVLHTVNNLPRFVRLVSYNYAKLDKGQYYVSPSKNHTGDMLCDCNTVMYR